MRTYSELELLVDLRQKNQELELVRKAEAWLGTALDEEKLAEIAVQQAMQALGAEMGFLMFWDAEARQFRFRAADDFTVNLFRREHYKLLARFAEEGAQKQGYSILHPNLVVEGKLRISQVLAIPLYSGERLLGVMGVVNKRSKRAFRPETDGAMAKLLQPLLQAAFERVRLLETIDGLKKMLQAQNNLSRITHTVADFAEMMIAILNEMEKNTGAAAGMAFSFNDETGDVNTESASDQAAQFFESTDYAFPKAIVRAAFAHGGTVAFERRELQRIAAEQKFSELIARNALCTPILSEGKPVGAFLLVNKRAADRFTQWDKDLAAAMAREAGTVLVMDVERKRLETMFSKYVSRDVAKEILAKRAVGGSLGGERRIVTVLFSDLRGSTSLSEKLPPAELVGLLNEYFDAMADIVLRNHGTIIRFIGDAMLCAFGITDESEEHEFLAVKTAMQMQVALGNLNAKWARQGTQVAFQMGIGVSTGEVIAGNIGSRQYMNFDLVGDAANTAARLSGKAEAGQILVTHGTYTLLRNRVACEKLPPMELKGKAAPVQAYLVKRMAENA